MKEKWLEVVTHPLGLVGYALWLVFYVLRRITPQYRWLTPYVFVFGIIVVLGGLFLGYKKIQKEHPSTGASLKQTTVGWCSPAIAEVNGTITVNCHGVDPKALRRLNELLDKKDMELQQMIQFAETWVRRYFELEQTISQLSNDPELARLVEALLKDGQLEEAGVLLDEAIHSGEKRVDQVASYNFIRAEILRLQYKSLQALPFYEKAYRYRPWETQFAINYGAILLDLNRYAEAKLVYLGIVKKMQSADESVRKTNLPSLAGTFNNLGIIYSKEQSFADAEKSYKKSLQAFEVYVKSAGPDREFILNTIADVHVNLGNLFAEIDRLADSEDEYFQALDQYKKYSSEDDFRYLLKASSVFNNLGILYMKEGKLDNAQDAHKEALGMLKDLKELFKANPALYLPLAAERRNNIGKVYAALKNNSAAEEAYIDSACIYRWLAKTNQSYHPRAAMPLENLGELYRLNGRLQDAKTIENEVLNLRQDRATTYPQPALVECNRNLKFK